MRQHLYKAKRIDNNEWAFGSLIIDGEDYYILPKSEDIHEAEYPYFDHEFGIIDGKIIPVILETVCEYVGISDHKGTKIFEHDIVLTQEFYDRPYSVKQKSKQFLGKVVYKVDVFNGSGLRPKHEYNARWDAEIINDDDRYGHYSWSKFYMCEVVGNIFDNPELLNKGE